MLEVHSVLSNQSLKDLWKRSLHFEKRGKTKLPYLVYFKDIRNIFFKYYLTNQILWK